MAIRSNLVNLDAMIVRADFSAMDGDSSSFENTSTISIRDFTRGALIGPSLRKPDFQRETNHWSPEQVVSLLECFVNGDLIPSVILWQSPTHLFVIDGGHRLSVLRAWVEDDYGDGHISQPYFGYSISEEQKRNAKKTRELIERRVGVWSTLEKKISAQSFAPDEQKKMVAVVSRALPVQWVKGDADKAESSFFKINTKGTPLDQIEELLLRNRHKPIAIAARAIIRSGKGHRYWSAFEDDARKEIEEISGKIHKLLFDPEFNSPVKTLDLPLGGPKGVRTAIQALIDLCLIATRDQLGLPKKIADTEDDSNGEDTIKVLKKTLALCDKVTGADASSLGLHPAVYFYGPTGRHSSPMFMGTMELIAKKVVNNDRGYFKKLTMIRERLEEFLIGHKDLMATILQRSVSDKRTLRYSKMLEGVIGSLIDGKDVSESDLVTLAGLEGKIIVGASDEVGVDFSDDVKSQAFISSALTGAMKCPICNGYLEPAKSVSYDHAEKRSQGGQGVVRNCQLTHPYCNTGIKG